MNTFDTTGQEFDSRGKKITTYEGHTGYIEPSIKEYFEEQYSKQSWRVVPGHWPTMETKKDVDNWIRNKNIIMEILEDL